MKTLENTKQPTQQCYYTEMTIVFNWHMGVVWCCLGLCFPISSDLICMLCLLQALIWGARWKSPLAASEVPLGIRGCPAPFVRLLDRRYLPRPNSSLVTSNVLSAGHSYYVWWSHKEEFHPERAWGQGSDHRHNPEQVLIASVLCTEYSLANKIFIFIYEIWPWSTEF